jgi:hypothetical protein
VVDPPSPSAPLGRREDEGILLSAFEDEQRRERGRGPARHAIISATHH